MCHAFFLNNIFQIIYLFIFLLQFVQTYSLKEDNFNTNLNLPQVHYDFLTLKGKF